MAHRLRRYPGVLERTVELAKECAFDFKVIAPKLPDFPVPPGETEMGWLRTLVERKAPDRYGPPDAERIPGAYLQIKHELDVIEQLGFAGYFLIVHDIVEFCEVKRILCQGRGSAANSAVCYALGLANVDPFSMDCCLNGSCQPGGMVRPTLTWISSTSVARMSFSTSTAPTAVARPRRSPT